MAQRHEIRAIQSAITTLGFNPGSIDGWGGPNTAKAAELLIKSGPLQSRHDSRYSIINMQQALEDLGYDPGKVDGIWGPKTRAALSFLVKNKFAPMASVVPPDSLFPKVRPSAKRVSSNNGVITQGSKNHPVTGFMLHTAATSTTWWRQYTNVEMFEEIRRWHVDPISKGGRGWRDMGYHYVIFPDGVVMAGRKESVIGAGAIGFNTGWLHACMVPIKTINRMGTMHDYYSMDTLASMRDLIKDVSSRTDIQRLAGHNEVANKLCPGFMVRHADWGL